MSTNNLPEELSKKFQQLLKKYNTALIEKHEVESLKKLYVELRELKWKIAEYGYGQDMANVY